MKQNPLRRVGPCTLALAMIGFVQFCFGQGILLIDFDGPPVAPPGSSISYQAYYQSGMSFMPVATESSFSRVGPGFPSDPQNGTAYLSAAVTQSLMFSFTNGSSFNMVAVDLAEYSTLYQEPLMVRFVGYRLDGSTVAADFTTDGIIDGTGPLADFQTFYFGPEFSNLIRVEIPTPLWSLDNLVVSVPEPGWSALLLAGGVWLRRKLRERHHLSQTDFSGAGKS